MYRKHEAKHYNINVKLNNKIKLLILAMIQVFLVLNTTSGILSYFTASKTITNILTIAGTYTVQFDANEGTGTMPDQKIFCGSSTNLNANTFTRTDYLFSGWNTTADGSGTSYSNEEVVQDLVNENTSITLYAQWVSAQTSATVTFDANGGNVTETSRIVTIGDEIGTLPVPTREDYEFLGWYTLQEGGTKISDSEVITQDETYYAIWNRLHYENIEGMVFDGTNYIDTDIKLFSDENIGKNFEISFEISDVAPNQKNQATIVNSMEEVNPYPGFVFRIQTNGTQMEFNAPKISNKNGININTTNKVMIRRINDIYYIQINDGNIQRIGTYNYSRTFDVPVVLGASIDVTPPRYFIGTLTNIHIDIWESETYSVSFDANGGTGTMPDQTIREDETTNLSANTFEREDWLFDGWNTEPDGSGTSYQDTQSVTNLVSPNENITLYAQWLQNAPYSVRFNSNGGSGTMSNQNFVYGVYQNLSSNAFTKQNGIFLKWNTAADGSGTDYTDEQSVKNLAKNANDIVDLYAIWSEKSYSLNQYVFDGTNYIDTGVYLFEENTIDRDFEISFEIVDQAASQKSQATLVSAMDESGSPWPGIVYRFKSGSSTEHQIGINVDTVNKVETNLGSQVTKVDIKRTNGVIYLKTNDGDFEELLDMSSLDKTFHVPLTFGTSLNKNGSPQRQFTGTLSNLYVEIF